MVVVGSDVHKRTHTFVAVDEVGRRVAEITVKADHQGHDKAIKWARERFGRDGCPVRWAIEDCRHLSARLEIDLLEAGEVVVRVPPKLMAEQRRLARTRGKSDPIDALAVARAALREPDLPLAAHDEASRELRLLVDRREDLVRTHPDDQPVAVAPAPDRPWRPGRRPCACVPGRGQDPPSPALLVGRGARCPAQHRRPPRA